MPILTICGEGIGRTADRCLGNIHFRLDPGSRTVDGLADGQIEIKPDAHAGSMSLSRDLAQLPVRKPLQPHMKADFFRMRARTRLRRRYGDPYMALARRASLRLCLPAPWKRIW